jgi:A/G-specific adenine glycosylase
MISFTKEIMRWYDANGRTLPWRQTKDPYYIWISEIILQQTRVNQGYDYYMRFIKRFPDVNSLINADEDEVLHYWQGLGYYSRARNLLAAAKSLKDGQFPTSYKDVLALKGVGEYTAAAICSFAYGMPIAVVDGNVYRVLARYFGIDTPIDSVEGKKVFAELAQSLLDNKAPGRYNQAMMDFGALQCVPSSPDCIACPLVDECIAYSHQQVNMLPVKEKHTSVSARYFNYIYVSNCDSFLMHKRTSKDIWKNLYELPLLETADEAGMEEIISSDFIRQLANGIVQPSIDLICKKKHILTHRIIYASFYRLELSGHISIPDSYINVPNDGWEHYAMPQLIYRFLEKYI